jgi:hypothetical protein
MLTMARRAIKESETAASFTLPGRWRVGGRQSTFQELLKFCSPDVEIGGGTAANQLQNLVGGAPGAGLSSKRRHCCHLALALPNSRGREWAGCL